MRKIAVIFAAGQGKRFVPLPSGIKHKALLFLAGKTLIEHTITYLLKVPNLKRIIIVTGAQRKSFLFLLNKYPNLTILSNLCFARHLSACALLRVKKYLLRADLTFLITADMVCYRNYFDNLVNVNGMAAIISSKQDQQQRLYYHVNVNKEIVAIHNWADQTPYQLGEFSTLKKDWVQSIYQFFQSGQKHCPDQEIYQILLRSALKNGLKLKMHLLKVPGPSDVDTLSDWEEIQRVF